MIRKMNMFDETLDNAMASAVHAVESRAALKSADPRDNKDYVNLVQLFDLAEVSYSEACRAAFSANEAKDAADHIFRELQVRREIMEADLGIKTLANHECDEGGEVDVAICGECREHASFCSFCTTSNCCGAGEVSCE